MPKVTFIIDQTGADLVVDAAGHDNLMHVAVENDIPNIEGECGGDMSCGTCHVYLESGPDDYAPPRSDAEIDMLDSVNNLTDASRLSCQMPISDTMDGLTVRVPAV